MFPLDAWPTFLIVDPESEKVRGRFLGSGSVQEIRGFVQEGVRAYREKGSTDPAWAAQREGDAARNRGDLKATAEAYGRAVALSKPGDPQRPERLNLYIFALLHAKDYQTCVETALREARNLPESAMGADFQSFAFACAEQRPKDDPDAAKIRERAVARLKEILAKKDAPLAADDRSDALATLAEMLDARGSHDQALLAMRERVQVLESAAAAAPDPTTASTFDPHRAATYLYLNEPPKAAALLKQRANEMPVGYTPP